MSTTFCHLCDYGCRDERALLKHLRDIHENDANFQVSCSLCGRTYRKWCSLKKHLHRSHPSKFSLIRRGETVLFNFRMPFHGL